MPDNHSYTYIIESYSELPEDFKESYRYIIGDNTEASYIIYSVQNKWGRKISKLICMLPYKLVVFEKTKEGITNMCYRPQDISYVQRRTVLLNSRLNICGTISKMNTITTIEFNSTSLELFKPFISYLRVFAAITEEPLYELTLQNIDKYKLLDYKFKNYASQSIIPGEKVQAMVFQPATYEKRMYIYRKPDINAHLSILTDKEWIIISEGEPDSAKHYKREDVFTFIPLNKVGEIMIEEEADKIIVNIILLEQEELVLRFDCSQVDELNSFIKIFSRIKRGCDIYRSPTI